MSEEVINKIKRTRESLAEDVEKWLSQGNEIEQVVPMELDAARKYLNLEGYDWEE